MFNTLLFVHLVISVLLIVVILLQKTSSDGLSGIGGGNNMGLVSGRSAAHFLTKTTVFLATAFLINALILANISTRSETSIVNKIESQQQEEQKNSAESSTLSEYDEVPNKENTDKEASSVPAQE